ncbi:probable GPI-anchored adhesin-like protein PGA55 isoform X1 [Oncorhynchus tshawytscha]|uniref:RRM domain-containing protein n=1 Tax=Oncorhynchus tshawytscha TaxID=74940 RepID=A0AAZ3QWI6_ONCTS|nr:probable GPI-anchored adhesin-like protein PGA55 isoform X1 [Oncorhynchus tshawytscha]XP_042173941.1 probable GPI-anchored adhesin-like protein PGA55 isoform X1 [Oncorhynchus tshawytscha]XP_042173942.1 probable GPI-anchored adhesin-like protein PGA55 isoform X1 [Oncorhynchus tshawytscha]
MNLSEENRTVVVSGVPDTLSSSRMADKLVIHFQSSRSHGGDVENIKYPTSFKGVAFVTFENTRDAEMVIRKKQIMCDKEFPQDYPITVFRFTQDVLFYVNAKVDLSICGDEEQQETVIQSLQSAHRSVRICLLPSQEGKASVEGPFSAIRDLREDLLQRATASSSSHPGEKHVAPLSSGYSLTSVAAGKGVSQVSSSHPGEKHGTPLSSGYSLTSVAAGNGVSQVSSSHPGEKHGAPSSSGYSLTSVAAGKGVSQVSSSHPGEKHGAPSSSGYSLTSVAAGNGVSQVSSSHAWEKHRAPSPSSHDHSLSSVVAESRSSRVRSGDGAEVDFRVSRYTWEKKNRAAPSSTDHSLSSSVAGGSGASTINQSLEKHRRAALSSSDPSLSSMASGGGESKVISSSHTLEKYIAPSSHDQSLPSPVAAGTSKVSSGGDVDMEEESTWVDTNIFLYIQRFSKDQFDQCFRNHGVSAVFGDNDVADLTLISLRGRRDSKGLSEVQLTISELTDLVAVWQSTLRIHTIDYRRQDLRERKRLLQICAEVNSIYEDVLYVQKELSVRVIGPSISSHLFTEWVKDRMDQPHKEDFL